MTVLYLALRESEVVQLQARDVAPRRLTYCPLKQRNGERRLATVKVPEALSELLEARAKECSREGRLFPHNRKWVYDHVRRLCREADVPVICAHGLRGSHATAAKESGETAEAIARQLSHSSTGITRRHYISSNALDDRAERLEASLEAEDPEAIARHIARLQLKLERALRSQETVSTQQPDCRHSSVSNLPADEKPQ